MANRTVSKLQTSVIDGLYGHILDQACESKEESEVAPMRQLVSMIVFLRNPLAIQPISSLAEFDARLYLSALTSVIHVPTHEENAVTPFHASFHDYVTDCTRCSRKCDPPFSALVASEGHEMLALKCLKEMNRSLKYNICEVPKELTVSRMETTNSPDNKRKISEALKYLCLYWASHFSDAQLPGDDLIDVLDTFLHKHLLHWIECLSELGELQIGIPSLRCVATALSHSKATNIQCHKLQLLADDGCHCLQMNFPCIQKHSFQIYKSALVWLPKKSLIRNVYATDIRRVPRVVVGLPNLWGSTELHMRNGSSVNCIAISQDGSRIVSGSEDKMVRIWNVTTGVVEAELKGHTEGVQSVAFSQDGSQVVSGSRDKTVRVWNAMTGEEEAELKGHRYSVVSVAFSQDGSRVVSGSSGNIVQIWNTMMGKVEVMLEDHSYLVKSMAFTQDGSKVVSGTYGQMVLQNVMTGEIEADLKCHMELVTSVVFSQDGSRVAFGLDGKMIRIWNTMTGEVEAELNGHMSQVTVSSVSFSQDGIRVVFGSYDNTVRIWNTMTGEVEAVLKGHMDYVTSVAFSQDGHHVVSGSHDNTIRVWNVIMDEGESELTGHTGQVTSLSFSEDGSRVVSGLSDKSVQIWNTTTGEVEAKLKGHTNEVTSVAFAKDGSQVISGSSDGTARIWNTATGELKVVLGPKLHLGKSVLFAQENDIVHPHWQKAPRLIGHLGSVMSVAFSQDGRQVVSGSDDKTVQIWDAVTGQKKAVLRGHMGSVRSVAFSQDGSKVVSGCDDKTVRIWNVMMGKVEVVLNGHLNSVISVVFSQDGSQVVSGSFDKTVWIWNIVTGESQLMATTSITLLDTSVVHRAGEQDFQISDPEKPTLSIHGPLLISDDYQWIVGPLHDCWIPSHNCDFILSSFSGGKVCFGYSSGNVIIFDLQVTP